MKQRYDLAVIESGFAGSLLAMCAARMGLSVVLLERGTHPRFAIGESSTPLSNLLLEELAERYNLPGLRPLSKWGSWQRSYPELACGLKRGFSFFHHDLAGDQGRHPFRECLHVAASPNDTIADTHWFRADFDAFFVREAKAAGVSFFDRVQLCAMCEGEEFALLSGARDGVPFELRAEFVIDATGPRGALHHLLPLRDAALPGYPATEALFGHFTGVARIESVPGFEGGARTVYPTDDAAVHHVFEGGWIWVLRFNNGVTSAGVAATADCARRLGLSRGLPAWQELLEKIPILREQFSVAVPVQPMLYTPQLSYRSDVVAGRRWALLPSAAGFVDPLLSTGFPLTLLGVSRLAAIFEQHWGSALLPAEVQDYAVATNAELLATARLVGALYASMDNFAVFRSLSLLYFAAASFSETAHRLGRPDQARSFLLHDHPRFGPECDALFERIANGMEVLEPEAIAREVARIVEPFDVAGLTREPRDSGYPVLARDLIDNIWKLGATQADAVALLRRAGFDVSA